MANLTQLRMLEDTDGFILVDKPSGIAFSTVVKTVKRKFNLVKVGHGGSLDAMASGLLVLLVNDANKFVDGVMGADRSYTGTMRLGLRTNTHDVYGEEIPGDGKILKGVAETLPEFKGDVFQTESRWCSIRRENSATYEIADTGEHKQHLAHVYRFAVEGAEKLGGSDTAERTDLAFSVKASKGLLVKTLVNDFGEALGCGAALASLRRTAVGKFTVEEAVPFARILETEMKDFASLVIPLSKALA